MIMLFQELDFDDDEIIKECIRIADLETEKAKNWREKVRQARLRQDEFEALAAQKYEEVKRLEQLSAQD